MAYELRDVAPGLWLWRLERRDLANARTRSVRVRGRGGRVGRRGV
ncbi:MAG TPA: hypothetical protein VFM83_03435 [Gaiellaceae bacterium]|nr:hypothetical protein [Gaiellaceae bacterium]